MRRRCLVLATLVVILGMVLSAGAQTPKPAARRYVAPRMADGHPDLQGTYDLATLPPLERPAGAAAVISGEEAKRLERNVAKRVEAGGRPIAGDRSAPPKGGDGSTGAAGNVGGYNNFWLDPGSSYTIVDGQKRTSLVIDPPDGHVP